MGKFKKSTTNRSNCSQLAFSLEPPCDAIVIPSLASSSDKEFVILASNLNDLLLWYRGAGISNSLGFSPALGKQERAIIHVAAQALNLVSESLGVGEKRRIVVSMGQGKTRRALTDEQRECSEGLYRITRSLDAYRQISKDELSEILFSEASDGHLRTALLDLWTTSSSELHLQQALIKAITAGDLETVTLVINEAKDVASATNGLNPINLLGLGLTGAGESPVCLCARIGAADALRIILREVPGINIDAKDTWSGKNALTVSRTFENCDVEAILLQAGAHDPDASLFPLTSVAAALGLKEEDEEAESEEASSP